MTREKTFVGLSTKLFDLKTVFKNDFLNISLCVCTSGSFVYSIFDKNLIKCVNCGRVFLIGD